MQEWTSEMTKVNKLYRQWCGAETWGLNEVQTPQPFASSKADQLAKGWAVGKSNYATLIDPYYNNQQWMAFGKRMSPKPSHSKRRPDTPLSPAYIPMKQPINYQLEEARLWQRDNTSPLNIPPDGEKNLAAAKKISPRREIISPVRRSETKLNAFL